MACRQPTTDRRQPNIINMSVKNKVALVTGAASGIGKATAITLAQKGAKVILTDIQEALGKETTSLIKQSGGEAIFYSLDVRDKAAIKEVIVKGIDHYGPIELAVNNAGIGGVIAATHEVRDDHWDHMMDINLKGVFYCMREEINAMLHHKGGSIVNVSSLAGLNGFRMNAPYCVAKHGVIGLTKSAAAEYATLGIRVNAVCPGVTKTPILDGAPEIMAAVVQARVPMQRMGKPEEIAQTICYLLSEEASYITGHCLPIDGGMETG